MTKKSFSKTLSANDVGATKTHQAGILVPKTEKELLAFFPPLDPGIKNPDTWIRCVDEAGIEHKFRFVYYNNKLHDKKGTRNEYRLTYMTGYLKAMAARENDRVELSRQDGAEKYSIRVTKQPQPAVPQNTGPVRIKITSAWRRIH
jgi:hypothetical protein